MATHPDDPNVPDPTDQDQPTTKPAQGEERKASRASRLARRPGKPTMMQHDEEVMDLEPVADEGAGAAVVDEDALVIEQPSADAPKGKSKSHVTAELLTPPPTPRPADDVLFTQDEPDTEGPPKEKSKSHVTAELLTPQPAPRTSDDVLFGSGEAPSEVADAEVVVEEMAGAPAADAPRKERPVQWTDTEHVLDDEPLKRGARSSAHVESPIPVEGDDDAVDLGGPPAPSGKNMSPSGIDQVAEALESGVDLEDEAPLSPTPGAAPAEEEAEAVAVPVEDEAEAVAIPMEENEAVAAPVTDEDTALATPPKGKRKDETDAAEAQPPRMRGKAKPEPVPVRSPSCVGRLIGTAGYMLVGIIIAVGAIAGLQFAAPSLVGDYLGSPTPKAANIAPLPAAVSPAQRAYEAMATGDFDTAIAQVKDGLDESARAALGKARALKLLKDRDLTVKPLDDMERTEMAAAIKDLRDGKNHTLASQIERAVREPDMHKRVRQSDQALVALQKTKTQLEADNRALAESVKDAATKADQAIKELADRQAVVAAVDKLLIGAGVEAGGPKGVAQLVAATKNVETHLGDINKALAGAKVQGLGAKGVHELTAARARLQKDRDELNAAITAAYAEMVRANVVPPGGDPRQAVAEGARRAREKGESPLALPLANLGAALAALGQGAGQLAGKVADTSFLAAQLAQYKLREPFVETPAKRFDLYAALLQDRSVSTPGKLAAIQDEAKSVLHSEARATPALQAKAHYITGLALRNQGKFDAARNELDSALKHAGAKGAAWHKPAQTALAELTDAHAYYLPQIARLQAAGNLDHALAQTAVALKALPGDGKLLAARARLRLEASRTQGKLSADAAKQIRSDAQAAAQAPGSTAEGEYLLGLLEAELGQNAMAEAHFREALRAHKGSDDDAARYRVALARVLLQDRPGARAPAAPAGPADEKERLTDAH